MHKLADPGEPKREVATRFPPGKFLNRMARGDRERWWGPVFERQR